MIVVSDTTPLHYLILIDQVHLLPELFGQVVTTPDVIDEMTQQASPEKLKRWVEQLPGWLEVKEPRDITESRGRDELKKAAYLGLILVIRRPPSPPEHATMSEVTSSTIEFPVSSSRDVLTEILRAGAQRMLSTAIEAEVAEWITSHAHLVDEHGRRQVVRNGRLPKRSITTGVGQVEIEQPRVHDRRTPAEREKFSSRLLPPYLRKTKSIEELIPWLYLMGYLLLGRKRSPLTTRRLLRISALRKILLRALC